MDKNKFCCDVFPKIYKFFGWFQLENDIMLMPFILNTEPKIRVNYCPSCGKYIRDISIKKNHLIKLSEDK